MTFFRSLFFKYILSGLIGSVLMILVMSFVSWQSVLDPTFWTLITRYGVVAGFVIGFSQGFISSRRFDY